VIRHIFQACPVWIYTQSNITSISFNWLKENVYLHRVIPTTLIYTGPTLFKLLQQMITLPRPSTLLFMKTSLLFENVSNDMLYKTSPSSSSKKPIYLHCVNHLLAFVPNCDFMLLDNIFTLIVWRSKAMENRWWWWTTFGVGADDGFAENVFRGIARLVAERPACENLFYKKKWKMAPPRFLLPPPPPLWPKIVDTLLEILEGSDVLRPFDKEQITQSESGNLLILFRFRSVLVLLDTKFKFTWVIDSVLRKSCQC
jgi:hypothetical protein